MARVLGACGVSLWLLASSGTARAQLPQLAGPFGPIVPGASPALTLAVDGDDDDDDGQPDHRQPLHIPADDLWPLRVLGPASGEVELSVTGGLRLVVDGKPLPSNQVRIPAQSLPRELALQGVRPTSQAEPTLLRMRAGAEATTIAVHVYELLALDARNRPIDPSRAALNVSLRVTNDLSLPRGRKSDVESRDPDNFRIELRDSRITHNRVEVMLQSVDARSGLVRDEVPLLLTRLAPGEPLRSRFVRLVADPVDARAAGVSEQVLRVALRDWVRVRRGPDLPPSSHYDLRVGRPGDDSSQHAALQLHVRFVILRASAGGSPVIGHDELSALELVRAQVALANQVWSQCQLTFGAASEVAVEVVDPPPTALLAIADGDGLPAAGNGLVAFLVNGIAIGPVQTTRGARPVDTAVQLMTALEAAGFHARVTVNPRTSFGADASADLLVSSRDGKLARIELAPGQPLSTDARQSVRIGVVDLGDGLDEFDNMTARSGTLEERTLLKAVMDDDPSSVDVIIVNRFARGSRQGEAFIEASDGSIANAVILDRNGLSHAESAWTLAHEIGHVLLDEPLHPDNVGPDQPWLLMDSDSSRGTVLGPKRLTRHECARVRRNSGPDAEPALLSPYDPRAATR